MNISLNAVVEEKINISNVTYIIIVSGIDHLVSPVFVLINRGDNNRRWST
jgi:hypothetical protein